MNYLIASLSLLIIAILLLIGVHKMDLPEAKERKVEDH